MLRAAITVSLATAAVVASFLVWGQFENAKRERKLAAYVDTLSQTAYLEIGGVDLQLPLAAVGDYRGSGHSFTLDPARAAVDADARRKKFREASANPEAPLHVKKVTLRIDTWGWDDFGHHDLYQTICPKLARTWARSVCDNPWSALQQSLPDSFDLADPGHLDLFESTSFAGSGSTAADHLSTMFLSAARTQIACDPDRAVTGQDLCTAARLVGDDLVAVWNVKHDTLKEDLQRAGDAIIAFVEFGLGHQEQFDKLIARACEARRSTRDKPVRDANKECPGD